MDNENCTPQLPDLERFSGSLQSETESYSSINWERVVKDSQRSKVLDKNGNPYPIWSTHISKLRKHGLGVWLYTLA